MRNVSVWRVAATLFFLMSVMTLTQTTGAAAGVPSCSNNGDGAIYFGNGINTEFGDAIDNLRATSTALKQVMREDEYKSACLLLAYNPTHGKALDIIESVAQDLSTDFGTFFMSLVGLTKAPEEWQEGILTAVGRITNLPSLGLTDSLKEHVTDYKAKIKAGRKVLVIAHSQGTFYANQAYSLLSGEERKSFGLLPVALMDDYVAGDYPDVYVTLRDDLAVSLVSAIKREINAVGNRLIDKILPWGWVINAEIRGPKEWNTDNLSICDDFMGHSYVQCYLAVGKDSRVKIQSLALYVYHRLISPTGASIILEAGDEVTATFRFTEPFSTNLGPPVALDVSINDQFIGGRHTTTVSNGATLLGAREDTRQFAILVSFFHDRNYDLEPLWGDATTPIDFSSIASRSIDGRVRIQIEEGTIEVDPTITGRNVAKSNAVAVYVSGCVANGCGVIGDADISNIQIKK